MDNGACSYRRFLDGDDTGFAEIVKDYSDGLMLFLNGFVNNISVAEELADETFFRLITKKPHFTPKHTFKTWLYTIGRNVALNYIRKSSKLSSVPFDDLENVINDELDLERAYIAKEAKLQLLSALKKLNPDYRNCLWLVYFEDLSNSEAAFVMKKSQRQFKLLHFRAKSALKSTLEKDGFVYEELY